MKYLTQKQFILPLAILDIIGSIVFFYKKFRTQPNSPKKVLFIRLEHIGDMVMATPVFETWKNNYPQCKIHVLCKNLTKPIINDNPFVDKILTYEPSWFQSRDAEAKMTFSELIKKLRIEKYDIVFEMHGDIRNNYAAHLTKAYSVGYGCRGGGFLLNKTVSYSGELHVIDQNLSLVKNFCKDNKRNVLVVKKPSLYTAKNAQQSAAKIMRTHGLKKDRYIIINPLSGRFEKDMTVEDTNRYICDKKINNTKTKIVILGSKSQIIQNRYLDECKNVINLTGKTTIQEMIELVRNSSKVIAPDTGIIHIAHALNVPFDAIYKTTDKNIWGY